MGEGRGLCLLMGEGRGLCLTGSLCMRCTNSSLLTRVAPNRATAPSVATWACVGAGEGGRSRIQQNTIFPQEHNVYSWVFRAINHDAHAVGADVVVYWLRDSLDGHAHGWALRVQVENVRHVRRLRGTHADDA